MKLQYLFLMEAEMEFLKISLKLNCLQIFFHLSHPLLPGKQAEMVILVSHCIRITCYVLKELLFDVWGF